MRLVLGLMLVLMSLGQTTSSMAQIPIGPEGIECEAEVSLNRAMKTLIMSVGCGGRIVSRKEALEFGRIMLVKSGFSEYDTVYSVTPVLPNSDGTTTLWALVVVDPD